MQCIDNRDVDLPVLNLLSFLSSTVLVVDVTGPGGNPSS